MKEMHVGDKSLWNSLGTRAKNAIRLFYLGFDLNEGAQWKGLLVDDVTPTLELLRTMVSTGRFLRIWGVGKTTVIEIDSWLKKNGA